MSRSADRPGAESPVLNVEAHNRSAWNGKVEAADRWTLPVSPEEVARGRRGDFGVFLTPTKPAPLAWFGVVEGAEILCLASGGGQQAPLLAAAGASVTVLDNAPRQLDQDRSVAEREGLEIRLELGLMTDLSRFGDESFDLVFHPVSNVFVPDVRPVWREVARVLRPGGALLAGVTSPAVYLFDWEEQERSGRWELRYSIPYADTRDLTPEALQARVDAGEAMEFGHTLEDQLGGQLDAGLVMTHLFEDADPENPLSEYVATYIATRAVKPRGIG